jgi:hypothetical protein
MEHTSGHGLKVSPQFLTTDRIGYLMNAGAHPGLAFTSGETGAAGT